MKGSTPTDYGTIQYSYAHVAPPGVYEPWEKRKVRILHSMKYRTNLLFWSLEWQWAYRLIQVRITWPHDSLLKRKISLIELDQLKNSPYLNISSCSLFRGLVSSESPFRRDRRVLSWSCGSTASTLAWGEEPVALDEIFSPFVDVYTQNKQRLSSLTLQTKQNEKDQYDI